MAAEPEGETIVIEKRRVRFLNHPDSKSRIMQFEIELTSAGGDITFGDTKEGTFAIRPRARAALMGSGRTGQGE